MRAALSASLLSFCLVLATSCGKPKTDTSLPEPQGPGGDSCAVYIEKVTSGVKCTAIDTAHCSCELVDGAAAPPTDGGTTPTPTPTDGGTGTPTEPQPPASGNTATLAFAPGPANTTVKCVSGPCPVSTAEVITRAYPGIAAAPSGTQVQLEFSAPEHKTIVNNYTLYPGTNQIAFTLEKDKVTLPDSATLVFQNAPSGTTVECVSGPCPDKKTHPADNTFPAIKLDKDDQTLLLRFNAPGYRTAMSSFQVSRGPNVIPVLMERRPAGK